MSINLQYYTVTGVVEQYLNGARYVLGLSQIIRCNSEDSTSRSINTLNNLMHYIAHHNPKEIIRITVCCGYEISALYSHYSWRRFMIPANVTLFLSHVTNRTVHDGGIIKGIGSIHDYYIKRVNWNEAIEEKFYNAMATIEKKSNELRSKGKELLASDSPYAQSAIDAADHASELHVQMQTAYNEFKKTGDREQFREAAEQAISLAKDSSLKNHRGYKEILGYAALGLLAVLTLVTAGTAYLLAGTVNYAINRQFFFSKTIKTDSINKVDDLKEVVDEITDEEGQRSLLNYGFVSENCLDRVWRNAHDRCS